MDLIITSCGRLDCLKRTIKSICKNLKYSKQFKFILHEDVLYKEKSKEVIVWAKDSMDQVIISDPYVGIGGGIMKLLDAASGEFVLKWEDDWVLEKEVNVDRLLKVFENEKVNQIQLNKRNNPLRTSHFNHREVEINGIKLTLCHEWGMAPSIWRLSYIRKYYTKPFEQGDSVNQNIFGTNDYKADPEWCQENIGAYWLGAIDESRYVEHIGHYSRRLREEKIWNGQK